MKNIAIIGGDLSGVSCAYFLDKFSGANSKKFNIDLIEFYKWTGSFVLSNGWVGFTQIPNTKWIN